MVHYLVLYYHIWLLTILKNREGIVVSSLSLISKWFPERPVKRKLALFGKLRRCRHYFRAELNWSLIGSLWRTDLQSLVPYRHVLKWVYPRYRGTERKLPYFAKKIGIRLLSYFSSSCGHESVSCYAYRPICTARGPETSHNSKKSQRSMREGWVRTLINLASRPEEQKKNIFSWKKKVFRMPFLTRENEATKNHRFVFNTIKRMR